MTKIIDGHKVVTINKSLPKGEALTECNKVFKVAKHTLNIVAAWIKGEDIYFTETENAREVWAVWKGAQNG